MTSSEPEQWIVVRNWDRFQHYPNRQPVWIKVYCELLDDPNFGTLTHAQRSTLLGLWLMYAKSRRQIPDSTAWITRQLGVRVTRATLEALNHAGFIEVSASKTLAPRYPSRAREKREEVERKDQELRTYEEPSQTLESARQSIDEMLNAMLRDVE